MTIDTNEIAVNQHYPVFEERMMENQYATLRKEIGERQHAARRIQFASLTGAPSIGALALKFELNVLIYAVPPILFGLVLMFAAERSAIMRAGRFIRTVIEAHLKKSSPENNLWWEHWLELDNSAERWADRIEVFSFYVIMATFYVFAMYFCYETDPQYITLQVKSYLLMGYGAIGAITFLIILPLVRVSTR